MAKTTYKVGDKVRIISTNAALCGFSIGDVDKITKSKHDGSKTSGRHTFEVGDYGFCDAEHIELVESKPSKKQRISALEQKVEAMQAEIDALKAAQKAPVTTITDAIRRYKERTPNEQASANEKRKAIIDEAKVFVEATSTFVNTDGSWHNTHIRKHRSAGTLTVKFEVNAEKRTVVALVYLKFAGSLAFKGIAKCASSDVFNADIGKAIALGRALGLDVSKFEKAIQPSEVVYGMVVRGTGNGFYNANRTFTINGEHRGYGAFYYEEAKQYGGGDNDWINRSQIGGILDDSEAQY